MVKSQTLVRAKMVRKLWEAMFIKARKGLGSKKEKKYIGKVVVKLYKVGKVVYW